MLDQGLIDVGELKITKSSLGKKRSGDRYLINLPMNRNYLWRTLYEKGVKVRIFMEIPRESKSIFQAKDHD